MDSEQGTSHVFDLDPPASTPRRIAGVVIGCIALGLGLFVLWFLLAPDPASGASSAEPVVDSIFQMCGQASLPRVVTQYTDIALPVWSRLCDVIQD